MNDQVLIIETGNSATDFSVYEAERSMAFYRVSSERLAEGEAAERQISSIFQNHPAVDRAAICSVVPSLTALFMPVLEDRLPDRVVKISSSLSLPFTLDYHPVHALGADRLALCALCRSLWPDEAVIALDMGTAITFDVVGSEGVYLGGMILPGLDLMTTVLHDRTAMLPQVTIFSSAIPLLGRSTSGCIESGVFWGCVKQVEGLLADIERYLRETLHEKKVRVIATGGSSRMIASAMANPPLIDDQAVLKGAKVLLEMNI